MCTFYHLKGKAGENTKVLNKEHYSAKVHKANVLCFFSDIRILCEGDYFFFLSHAFSLCANSLKRMIVFLNLGK